jgi:hypothetical protein
MEAATTSSASPLKLLEKLELAYMRNARASGCMQRMSCICSVKVQQQMKRARQRLHMRSE